MALQDLKDISGALKAKEKELRELLRARTRRQRLNWNKKNGNIQGIVNILKETKHDNRHGQD